MSTETAPNQTAVVGESNYGRHSIYIERMNIEEIAAMEGSYIVEGFTPGAPYAFWDGDDPREYVVAEYSHSEVTTPIDRHWTKDKKYFHNVAPVLLSIMKDYDKGSRCLSMWVSPLPATRAQTEFLTPEHSS